MKLSDLLSKFPERLRHWTSRKCWHGYVLLAKSLGRMFSGQIGSDNEYQKKGFRLGTLKPEEISPLLTYLEKAPTLPMSKDDHPSGYTFNSYIDEEKGLNQWFHYYDLKGFDKLLHGVLESMIPKIQDCLEAPVKVVNIRCWGVLSGSPDLASNKWHIDGFLNSIHKALIFLTPPGSETGTTQVKLPNGDIFTLEGPVGSWIFFNPSNYVHRGVPPKTSGERLIIEVTLTPAIKSSSQPVFAGLNACYPIYPWSSTQNYTT